MIAHQKLHTKITYMITYQNSLGITILIRNKLQTAAYQLVNGLNI